MIADDAFLPQEPQPAAAVRQRIALLAVLFCLGFGLLAATAASIAVLRDYDVAKGDAQAGADKLTPRADILDRNGDVLATSITTYTLYANPAEIWDADETTRAIRRIFPQIDHEDLRQRLSDRDRKSVHVRTNLTPRERQAVLDLGQPGLGFVERQRRAYPRGTLAAHVLGYTDTDDKALAGVEKGLDQRLTGEPDAPVRLSIDLRVQHVIEAELAAAATAQRAKGGVGAIMDVETGEFLALASWPTFSPAAYNRASDDAKINRASVSVFEMGSTFKAFTVAMGLDAGVATVESGYDATRPLVLGGAQIRDFHAQNRFLTIPEILNHSSNIGTSRLALDVGPDRQRAFLARLGLLDRAALETADAARPLVPREWSPLAAATVSYGHGVAVSSVALMRAFAATVNGGVRVEPTLLKRDPARPILATPVMQPETSAAMVRLLRQVVTEGTAGKAESAGYEVAGKTGTAEKLRQDRKGYDRDRRVSSFIGVFPARAPRYAVLVLLDEPQGNAETHGVATAGWTAAPAVSRIVTRAAPMLGLAPIRQVADAGALHDAAGATP